MEVELGELQKQIYREGTHTAPILKCGAFPPLLFFSRRLKKPKRRKSAALQSAGWPSREAELPNHYSVNQFPGEKKRWGEEKVSGTFIRLLLLLLCWAPARTEWAFQAQLLRHLLGPGFSDERPNA